MGVESVVKKTLLYSSTAGHAMSLTAIGITSVRDSAGRRRRLQRNAVWGGAARREGAGDAVGLADGVLDGGAVVGVGLGGAGVDAASGAVSSRAAVTARPVDGAPALAEALGLGDGVGDGAAG